MSRNASDLLNDFRPEVSSLIATLEANGFTIVKAFDGEEYFRRDSFPTLAAFVDQMTGTDDCNLIVRRKAMKDSVKTPGTRVYCLYSLTLIYGNSPGELLADWGVPHDAEDSAALDKASKEHGAKWEGKEQPTVTAGELWPHIYGKA